MKFLKRIREGLIDLFIEWIIFFSAFFIVISSIVAAIFIIYIIINQFIPIHLIQNNICSN